jgi:RNA recognition motif-containing protein
MKIFVGNIPEECVEDDILALFSPFGEVDSVKIIRDFKDLSPRGFAFVGMRVEVEFHNAIRGLNGRELMGRVLVARPARTQTERRREERRKRSSSDYNGPERRKSERRKGPRRSDDNWRVPPRVGLTRADQDHYKQSK